MDKNNPLHINYARPSFLEGMARALDLGGTLSAYDADYFEALTEKIRAQWLDGPDGPQDDAEAIHECWVEVGNYLRGAMGMPLLNAGEKRRLRMQARRQADGTTE